MTNHGYGDCDLGSSSSFQIDQPFSFQDFKAFQEEMERRNHKVNALFEESVRTAEGAKAIYDQAALLFKKRRADLVECKDKLYKEIEALKESLKDAEKDEFDKSIIREDILNKETYRQFVCEAIDKEDFYMTDAMRKLMKISVNNKLNPEN